MQSDEPSRRGADPWLGHYAQRAAGMVPSEVRALFAVASHPEIVSLAGGMPNVSALPMDAVARLMADLVMERGPVALQYGSAEGNPSLRETICTVMAQEGIDAHPDDVVVTVGSQQALDLVARVFLDPGDTVVTEGPTYVTALGTFAAYQARAVHVAMDERGVLPEALGEAFTRLARDGGRQSCSTPCPPSRTRPGSRWLPNGVYASWKCAAGLGCWCWRTTRTDFCTWRASRCGPCAPTPRRRRVSGSFSKTLAPGLRVGWALAPSAVRDKLVLAAESAMLSHSAFAQLAVDRYLRTQPWQEQLKVFREMYRERRDAMLGALQKHMPAGVSWTQPDGGFFVWVALPEGLDSKAMLPRAVQARVAYVPGTGFYADGEGRRAMRLSYCYPPPERILEGVHTLADVIGTELELWETFGTTAHPHSPS